MTDEYTIIAEADLPSLEFFKQNSPCWAG